MNTRRHVCAYCWPEKWFPSLDDVLEHYGLCHDGSVRQQKDGPTDAQVAIMFATLTAALIFCLFMILYWQMRGFEAQAEYMRQSIELQIKEGRR